MTSQVLRILFLLLLSLGTSLSQDKTWIITIATGDTLSGCSMVSLDGDSLRIVWSGYPVSLPVASIHKLQYHRESEFWLGACYGTAAGAGVGTVAGLSGEGSGSSVLRAGVLGALGGFAICGLAADIMSRDDRYDLQSYELPEKKEVIRRLLEESNQRTETRD